MGLQMTAMIDVIFLLLAFMVLTARFRGPEQYVSLEKPRFASDAKAEGAIKPLRVELKPAGPDECLVSLGGQEPMFLGGDDAAKGLGALAAALKKLRDGPAGTAVSVELYCDQRVQWDWVVKVYDVFFSAGARDITFVIEQK